MRRAALPLLVLPVLLGLAAPALAAPRIGVSPAAHDFGRVDEGTQVTFTLTLSNGGDAPLEIRKIETTCGCTTLKTPGSAIPPGGSVPVPVNFDSRGRIGKQEKGITFRTNDPVTPALTVTVTGQVDPLIDISPLRIEANDLRPGEKPAWEVAIGAARPGVTFRVTGFSVNWSGIAGELVTLERGRRYTLRLRSTRPLRSGFFRALVKVHTDHPAYPTVGIPVVITVPTDLVTLPDRIPLAAAADGPYTVALRSRSGTPFRVTRVVVPDPRITWRIIPDGPSQHRIEFVNLPAGRPGTSIRIVTSHPAEPEFDLPLR
jgi:hypothetical protein